jgi:type IV secretory pathway VirJ component
MRLGQLARKLALRPAEIVGFLAKNGIQIEEGSNTRIEDDHVSLIMNHFAPERMAEMTAELAAEKIPLIPEVEVGSEPVKEIKVEEIQSRMADVPSVNPEPVVELIKAPKVELSGLKVLGKIELPESKKKEPQQVESITTEDTVVPLEEQKKPEPRKPFVPRKERSEQRPVKNPIALQREREATEAEKKRRANAEREKEKRTQNYLKKVKPAAPTKALKIMNDRVEEIVEEKVEPPKTWLGKFMRWMNT